jgi:hypothetical protein
VATSNTSICNMALAGLGATRIVNYEDNSDTKLEAIYCRLFYEQTRKALLRSHVWRFARARASLSESTDSPAFEWDNQFELPNDFLRKQSLYEDNATAKNIVTDSYAIEGKLILTNETSVNLRYIRDVTDPTEFDPLFVEVFVLMLRLRLVMPLTQDPKLQQAIEMELVPLMRKVRAMDREEADTIRRAERRTWLDARQTNDGRIPSQMGN